jgi:hypothetical protein
MSQKRSLLFIATRQCRAPQDGRSRMLRQWVDALRDRFVVHYVYMAPSAGGAPTAPADAGDGSWRDYPAEGPTWLDRARSVLFRRGRSLQEHYFHSGRFRGLVDRLYQEVKPDVIVVDMARLYQYLPKQARARVVVDLDDLLSMRYGRMLQQGKPPSAGRFASGGTRLIESAMRAFPSAGRAILRMEKSRIDALECRIVEQADAIVMTSPLEAALLGSHTRSGPKIVGIPPGFQIVSAPKPLQAGRVRLGFFGNLDYGPNLESIAYLNSALAPALRAHPGWSLTIAGSCSNPEALRQRLDPAISFIGFVKQPQAFYEEIDIVLAPIFSGTGIRTKVLEAISYGCPVLGTAMAFEGIVLENVDAWAFDGFDDLLGRVRALSDDWSTTVEQTRRLQQELFRSNASDRIRQLYLGVCEPDSLNQSEILPPQAAGLDPQPAGLDEREASGLALGPSAAFGTTMPGLS